MRLFLVLVFISFNVQAASWYELAIGKDYKLNQSFQLPLKERSHSLLDFMKGEDYELNDIIPLDMIKVVMFSFNHKNCPGPQAVTEMEIIPVHGTSPVVELGAQLEKDCALEIFIENKDLMTNSVFE
jgi:hypothetical protein